MRIGTHVSIAKGVWNAPGNAAKVGAEVFQIFSRSPHGGAVVPITKDIQNKFAQEMDKYKFDTFYIHAPYFINFSSVKGNIYYGSISVVRQELERGTLLGAKALMTHLGSFGELTDEEGIERQVKAIIKVMEGYHGTTQLLLEISAGAGRVVGDTFEELAWILDDKRLKDFDLGVCLDTCHLFASGYDIRDKKSVDKMTKQLEKVLGLKRVVLLHANDSKGDFGNHLDRHENIGEGKIGLEGFKALASQKFFSQLDWILETPKDNPADDPKNIAVLTNLRKISKNK
ncbi:MAG TPA: deoxyribonuclease IV [Patescibacteria group bacterium]|nr:deoxyribonuclease IV [Patescibacteria group bacterium]